MEEFGRTFQFLENKTLLVTGATGFLSKILAEKILRTQPKVKKLYLLVRVSDTKSANQRLQNEILGKELFQVLKQKLGGKFEKFIEEKVKMVGGDISCQDLGIKEVSLMDEMAQNLDVIINLAANTNFDERYDVSLLLNTFGAKNVLDFAKKCTNLKVLVHVSTAYVAGERDGLILEKSHKMGEALNGVEGLDIEEEKRIMEKKMKEVERRGNAPDVVKLAMKDFGLQRARKYGWPNVYVFTKALGEMLITEHKDWVPLVIIRPTIVTSTYKEPFPGWVEGLRTIDSLAVGYGKGRLTFFAGDPKTLLDTIPGDMVVNATLVAMVAHASQPGSPAIYQVGSSVRNPVTLGFFHVTMSSYFKRHPLIDKEGNPIIVGDVKVLGSMDSFNKYLYIRYLLPLKGLKLVNMAFCEYFGGKYIDLNTKIKLVLRMIDLYKPYLFSKAIFDDTNCEKLRVRAREGMTSSEGRAFYFDPTDINWEDYFLNTHFPGVVKYVLK